MSAIAHVPGSAWAATHRVLLLALAMVLVAAALALTYFVVTGGSPAAAPDLPTYVDSCVGALPGTAC